MRSVRYIDISVPLGPGTTVYPGDPPPRLSWPAWSHERGDVGNLGYFEGSLHAGTHADAPWHFVRGGLRLDEVPLGHWLGPCYVADLTHAERCVDATLLDAAGVPTDCRRLLLKTRNGSTEYWREPFKPDFVYLHASAARWCVRRGIVTVGFDYLTVDPLSEPTFPAHLALLGGGAVIIECLNLAHAPPGGYELLAAPVRLQGADGGWCRATLRSETSPLP